MHVVAPFVPTSIVIVTLPPSPARIDYHIRSIFVGGGAA